MYKRRLCKICGMPLSDYNYADICFYHKDHPGYDESLIDMRFDCKVGLPDWIGGYKHIEYNWIPMNRDGLPRELNFDYRWPEYNQDRRENR